MKLKEFNQSNAKAFRKGVPSVSFSERSGLIGFNVAATKLLNLEASTPVVICQDEDNIEDWYIAIKEGGLLLRVDKRGKKEEVVQKSYGVNSKFTVKSILESLNIDGKYIRCNLGTEPVEVNGINYYPLITKGAKVK